MWLEKQPGQRPRYQKSTTSERGVSKERRSASSRDGLQSTLANATIAKKFAALRRIYRALIAADLGITKNPFDTDRTPAPKAQSGQKRPTEMLDFSKVKEILELPDPETAKGLRDRAHFGRSLWRGAAS